MKLSFFLLPFMIVLFFTGCNDEQTKSVKMINDTYHMTPTTKNPELAKLKTPRESRENEILLAKMKSAEALEIAKIEAKSKEERTRIEQEAVKVAAHAQKEAELYAEQTKKEIASSEQETKKEIVNTEQKVIVATQEKDLYFYKILIGVVALLVLIVLLILYLMHRKNKATEIKLQEDRQRHEEQMQASTQYHEKTTKMLEIIADEGADKLVKKELLRLLRYQDQNQVLIAHQPDDDKEDEDIVEVKAE